MIWKAKYNLTILMAFALAAALVSPARCGEPSILMTHSYQGYTSEGTSYTMTFTLLIDNPTATPLYDVVISNDAANWLGAVPVAWVIGDLAAGDRVEATITLETRRLPSARELREMPLLWLTEAQDNGSQPIVGLTTSYAMLAGGAL